MDCPTSHLLISDARRALDELRLADALDTCEHLGLEERIRPTREAYLLMLDYLERGTQDKERPGMYRRFVRETHEALDYAERELCLQDTPSLYSLSHHHPVNSFDRTFTLPALSLQEAGEITGKLDDEQITQEEKCLTLSALLLGLLYFFDARKMQILMRYLHHEDSHISARALTGAVLAQLYWHKRLAFYPEITIQWQGIDVLGIQMRLLLTLETKKIEKSIREDIMPGMMEHLDRLGINRGKGIEDMAAQLQEAMTANPDWAADESLHDRIAEKIQQMATWQQQGADIYLGSLGAAKTRLSYFKNTANWFRPYNGKLSFLNKTNLCDSDKWTIEQFADAMPAMQQRMLEELGNSETSFPTSGHSSGRTQLSEISSYLQDLYRFFHLHPQHRRSVNPFKCDLLLAGYGVFDDRIDDAQALQRIGLTCMKHGDYGQAVRYLERADLLKSDDVWTLGRLAFCHRVLGETEQAIHYYKAVERLLPDDSRNLCRLGECLIRLKHYDEAFRYLFKANYLSDDAPQTVRALAWCALQAGETEKAETFYAKLLGGKPTVSDWINAGHTALIRKDAATAVDRYLHAAEPGDIFSEDRDMMLAHGFTAEHLAWITDMAALKKRRQRTAD
ncbi:MAG: hypothetical protein J1F06_07070 [Prevotellaceae bacterium]|nr:hypothetical protein [Prevotellaceae bacterium]